MEEKASKNYHLKLSSSSTEYLYYFILFFKYLIDFFTKLIVEYGQYAAAVVTKIWSIKITSTEDGYNDDTFYKELAETFERITKTAQAKCNQLKSDLETRQINIDLQDETNYFALLAELEKAYEEEIANLHSQLEKSVSENAQIRVDLNSSQEKIHQLTKNIEEQKTNYEEKISQLHTAFDELRNGFTRLGNGVMERCQTTATTDGFSNNYPHSAEKDEGIAVNTSIVVITTFDAETGDHSAASTIENFGSKIAHSFTISSTAQAKDDTSEVGNTMPDTSTPVSNETTVTSNLFKDTAAPSNPSHIFTIHPDCQNVMQRVSDRNARYIIFKIEEEEIVVDTVKTDQDIGIEDGNDYENNSKQSYEAFLNDLKYSTGGFIDCRYAVFDFKYQANIPGSRKSIRDKILFIYFCSDKAEIKKKMIYALCAYNIKAVLCNGNLITFQASESEISHEQILKKMIAGVNI